MKSFRFLLERALDWRRMQFEMEEAAYKRELASLNELDRAETALTSEAALVEARIREAQDVSGKDLIAFGSYRLGLTARKEDLKVKRAEASRRAEERQISMVAARRRFRLLEKLKDRRLEEWTQSESRELEDLAADSYLARYCRDRARPGTTI
jgi:hypothetical protein